MARVALEAQRFLSCYFVVDQDSEINAEEPLRYEAMTGLDDGQLTELVARVHTALAGGFVALRIKDGRGERVRVPGRHAGLG
jgi:hypothetical protein